MSGENQNQEIVEWILLSKETSGHVFHGNQHTGGIGGADKPVRQRDPNRFQVPEDRNKVSTTTGLKSAKFKGIIDEVNKNGGTTISMIGAKLPKDGYFCALGNPHASQMSIDDFENRDQAIQAVRDFIEKNASELGKDGNYLGIFKDESTGTVDFDISQHIPKLEDAISAGASRDQKSIWDIANSDVIGTGGSGKLDKHLKRSALVTKAKNNPLYLAQLPKDIESMTKEQILEVATKIVDSISPKSDTESK